MTGVSNPFDRDSVTEIVIRVDNLNFNDATVHALSGGSRTRLGIVSGKSREAFRLDWPSTRDLRMQIDLLAGGRHTTNPVNMSPGDRADLVIQVDVRRSVLRR